MLKNLTNITKKAQSFNQTLKFFPFQQNLHFQHNFNTQNTLKSLNSKYLFNFSNIQNPNVSQNVIKKRQQQQQKLEEDENYLTLISKGIFPNWFLSLSVLLSLNLGTYLLWNIGDQKDSENLKGFLEDNFCLSNDVPQKKGETKVKLFPNILLSSFLHTDFLSLLTTLVGFWAFHRPLHNYLGVQKFWGLYVGAIFAGFIGDRFFLSMFNSQKIKQDDVLRRWNIIKGQNPGYINTKNQGSKDSIMAMTAFVYSGLLLRHCSFIGKNYLYLFIALPIYIAYDFQNYFYPKYRYHNGQDITMLKPHFSAFLYGIVFGVANELHKNKMQFHSLDKNKLAMVAIYTTMLLIVFAYLNEYRVFNEGERMLMHKSKHRNYLLTINYDQKELEEKIKKLTVEIDSKQLSNDLINLREAQQKLGDVPIKQLYEKIQSIKEYDERYLIIKLLQHNIKIFELTKHESQQQKMPNYKTYYYY